MYRCGNFEGRKTDLLLFAGCHWYTLWTGPKNCKLMPTCFSKKTQQEQLYKSGERGCSKWVRPGTNPIEKL